MKTIVSAGDLEKYAYCPLSWWLSREERGHTEEQEKGIEKHSEIEKKIEDIALKERESAYLGRFIFWFSFIATAIFIFGIIVWPLPQNETMSRILVSIALLWLIFSFYFLREREKSGKIRKIYDILILATSIGSILVALSSMAFVLPTNPEISRIMQVLSLIWLMGATFFLRRSAILDVEAEKVRKKMNVPEGEIIYVDLDDENAELLISERYGLSGRPDHIIKKGGTYIPVELKTGRTPRGPLFSHIVQVGAYCMILEDLTGKAPPYGIIKYPEKSFEIEYTDELKSIIMEIKTKLLRDLERGEAHRNHNRPGKCRHCSRRKICPESLA